MPDTHAPSRSKNRAAASGGQSMARLVCLSTHATVIRQRDKVFPAALDALAFLRLLASFVFSELLDPVIDFYGNFTYDFGSPYYFATLAGSGVLESVPAVVEK